MKLKTKISAVVTAIFVSGALSAFGQGYVIFQASKGFVYDNFGTGTPTGTPVMSGSEISVTFLWSTTGANDLLGAGLPTTGGSAAGGFADLETMVASDGWNVATVDNAGVAGNEADVAVNSSAIAKGGISYNGGSAFQLYNAPAGSTIDIIVVGWNNVGGSVNTLEAAEASSVDLGWDSEFTYATGASAASPIAPSFNTSGGAPFGLVVPEPATLALAGLGGLALVFFRRRKA